MQRFFLVIDNVETEIQQPEGWGDMQRSISRQMETFGFMEEFSKTDLTFHCGGSDLPGGLEVIQDAYNAKGPDADVYFKVIEDCNQNGIFETINFSLLDLYEAPNNADWYKAPTEAESFQTVLSKRYKTNINLLSDKSIDNDTIQTPTLKEVFLHGKAIIREYEAYPNVDTKAALASSDPDQTDNQRRPLVYFGFDKLVRNEFGIETDEGDLPGVYTLGTGFSYTRDPLISIYDSFGNSRIKITVKIDSQIVIERNRGDFETVEIFYYLKIRRATGDTNIILAHDLKGNISGAYDSATRLNRGEYVSNWIDLVAGDKIYLYGDIDVRDVSGSYRMTYRVNLKKTSYLKIEGYTVSAGSNGYGLFVHEALSKAVAVLTGQDNIFISNYFGRLDSWLRAYTENGCGANFLFTIGKLLKGRLTEKDNTPIALTSSLSTLIESLQSIFCIGYTYEYEQGAERVVIEDMEYFFQNYEILSFDDISDFEISPAQDLIHNTIEVGYEKYETEEVNGADEFNSKRHYSTPVKKHESKLNLLSKFVTGGYPIEFTRQSRLRSADYKYDNNNFLISVKEDILPGLPVLPDASYTITGITDENKILISEDAIEQLSEPGFTLTITGSSSNNGTYTVVDYYTDEFTGALGENLGTFTYLTLDPVPNNTDDIGTINFNYPDTPGEDRIILSARKNESFSALNNVVDPDTIYNAEISPVRNLLRWAKYINGGLTFKQPTEVLKFTYGEGNYLLESQLKESETCLGGDVNRNLLKENQDFALSAFNQFNKLWIAEYITFKAECSYDEFLTIRENLLPDVAKAQKNGYISVNYLDEQYQGFPMEVNYEPNKRICTFKLLRKYIKPVIQIIAETGELLTTETTNDYLIKE
jgi:hypothetical protein